MFQAVRRWWSESRARNLGGLFAFEFVVVMTGVLAAQWLANWVDSRSEQGRLESSLERIRRDAGYNMAAAQSWQRAAPCLANRMTDIMRSASSNSAFGPADLRRPSIRLNYFEPLSTDDDLLLRERGQDELADSIQQFDASVAVMAQRLLDIADRWSTFELLEPENGHVMREDRVAARHSAGAIRADLNGVAGSARSLLAFGGAIGARPIYDPGERLPRNCDEIWSSGRTVIVGSSD